MSRLHILQGISGTGKTSLPIAVARAIGAGMELIEVQAGWRDRHDLIGHFNEFERRYYESEFLQALYKAGCPEYADRPFFVVLDEMNLSHPEQYFADLLSALEQRPELQRLDLMEAAVDAAPRLFSEGRKLPIPPNVWFLGTANHDETTMGFADKTFDRAHVMELPIRPEPFDLKETTPRDPISMQALDQAFADARRKHRKVAGLAFAYLRDQLAQDLGSRFGIGWGNRLERQMLAFVPVVVASGGTAGEAVDHVARDQAPAQDQGSTRQPGRGPDSPPRPHHRLVVDPRQRDRAGSLDADHRGGTAATRGWRDGVTAEVRDRLTGTSDDRPTEPVVLGRFLVRPSGEGLLLQNTFPVTSPSFLVPDASGRWTLAGDGAARTEGSIGKAQIPDPLDVRGFTAVGGALGEAIEAGGSWLDATELSPLQPGMSERADLQPHERQLGERLRHLEAVCRRPRTKLDVEVERMAVSRARRVAPGAANYLAAHTEDWERRTLRSVVPRRILAVVRDDRFDIYENRVAARLVDRLSTYLEHRIQEVTRLIRVFQEASDYRASTAGGSIWRQQRLYRLWGESIDASEARRTAERTLRDLDLLRQRVGGLKDSVLYREVPRRAEVGGITDRHEPPLRTTSDIGGSPTSGATGRI